MEDRTIAWLDLRREAARRATLTSARPTSSLTTDPIPRRLQALDGERTHSRFLI